MCTVQELINAGLGLDYGKLCLDQTTEGWVVAGAVLRDQVAAILEGNADGVEQIGSSSVVGVLAKPIIDLAVELPKQHDLAGVRSKLENAGWIYRGDAGDDGGHVFVLEARARHRVAHLHVVDAGCVQWRDYLRFRDLLRRSSDARSQYEAVKLRLIEVVGGDREAYTDGKSDIVRSLLLELE